MDELRQFYERLEAGMSALAHINSMPLREQKQRMAQHYQLLKKWNKVYNLTALKTVDDYVEKLFLDSWVISAGLPQYFNCIEVGSGAGFPSLVLLALFPQCQAILFEKVEKKSSFLKVVCAQLNYNQAVVLKEEFSMKSDFSVLFNDKNVPRVFISRATFEPQDWLDLAQQVAIKNDIIVVQTSHRPVISHSPRMILTMTQTFILPWSKAKRVNYFYRVDA